MAYSTVIIIHSFADKIMKKRLNRINKCNQLAHYTFHHLVIFERGRPGGIAERIDKLTNESQKLGADVEKLRQEIDELHSQLVHEDVKPRLLELAANVRPDLILVHGGTLFTAVTGPILQMLIDVRDAHRDIPIALEGRREWIRQASQKASELRSNLLSWNPYGARTIRNQIEWVEENCIEDEEINMMLNTIF